MLQALVNYPDVWGAGASSFGISDLAALAGDTHKFERCVFEIFVTTVVRMQGQLTLTVFYHSQYMRKLLGGTIEEIPAVWHDRSPVNFAEKITAPTLVRSLLPTTLLSSRSTPDVVICSKQILQGADDKVVPPNQSQMIVEKIKGRGGKVKYIEFEGEGHGWRKSETVKRATEEEMAWYEEVFGLGPAK